MECTKKYMEREIRWAGRREQNKNIKIYRMTRISNVCRAFNCWENVMIYIPDITNEYINYKNRESIIFTSYNNISNAVLVDFA